MTKQRFAEDSNYWDTQVHPAKSQGEITELLEDFGIENIQFSTGKANGKTAWLIRFEWEQKSYRLLFTPLTCRMPTKQFSRSGKTKTYEQQAVAQMGRRAVYMVKAILTAALEEPAVMFGFMELPSGGSGLAPIVSELDVSQLTQRLALPMPVIDAEMIE